MKISTWRLQGIAKQLSDLLAWLDTEQPTVLCLQGTGVGDSAFPLMPLFDRGYFTKLLGGTGRAGQAIISAEPPRDVQRSAEGGLFTARVAGVWVINAAAPDGVGLAQGHPRFEERLEARLRFLSGLEAHARSLAADEGRVVIAGDLGVSPRGDEIVDREHWAGRLGAHDRERAALGALRRAGFEDLMVRGTERPSFGGGLRSDLVLCNAALRTHAVACEIPADMDLEPAQHAPVSAVFGGIQLSGLGPGVLPE